MPKLIDMAYTKAELKEEKAEMCCPDGQPALYPWGLCIRLEQAELDKLGVTQLPNVGDEFHFLAVAKVTSVNQSAREGQDDETGVGLQITMMEVLLKEPANQEKGKETPADEAKETPSIMSYYKG